MTRCDFSWEEAYIKVITCLLVVKFAHDINLISEELLWWLNIILSPNVIESKGDLFFAHLVTVVPVLHNACAHITHPAAMDVPALRAILFECIWRIIVDPTGLIGCEWVEYLTALTILNDDQPRFILVSVCVRAYMDMYIILDYQGSKTGCAYCFEKFLPTTAVMWHSITSHPSKEVSLLWAQ